MSCDSDNNPRILVKPYLLYIRLNPTAKMSKDKLIKNRKIYSLKATLSLYTRSIQKKKN